MTTVTNKMNRNEGRLPFKIHGQFQKEYNAFFDEKGGSRYERRVAFHVKEMMEYLGRNDPEKFSVAQQIEKTYGRPRDAMKWRLREALGETHWLRYLEYYNHLVHTGDRIRIDLSETRTQVAPPLPKLTEALNANVTEAIFAFLDEKTMFEASKVSRAFRDAFIPRQRKVTMAGFSSLESFQSMNFLGAEFLTAGECKWLTDDMVPSIVEYSSMPNLTRVRINDFRITLHGTMGPRLKCFDGHTMTTRCGLR